MFKRTLATLLVLTALLFSAQPKRAFAAPESNPRKVVLMSSLKLKFWNRFFHKRIETIFKHRFKDSGYEIIIDHDGDQQRLWQALHDRQNIAVFWMSHAGASTSQSAGMGGMNVIIDKNFYDVAPIFKEIDPAIRYVGVVGCNSQKVIDNIIKNTNPNLKIETFDHKVRAKRALRQAIVTAKDWLASHAEIPIDRERDCPVKTGITATITRTIPANATNLRSVRVENGNQILTVFAAGSPGETQTAEVHLPINTIAGFTNAATLKIINNAGDAPITATSIGLGTLDISAYEKSHWSVFADKNGTPIGVTKNIYKYDGYLLPNVTDMFTPYQSFESCKD